ncbi:MAG TPA: hypothetical protein IGR64_04470 [Leptolyngbyaceae cyanobacterium M65_K2018_010]|nr:hypothetical protein [Leptolyngbyaceae cyanobacterium M65_K2018_010]
MRPAASCPQDIETLVPWLLQDLPSYANRVASRGRGSLAQPLEPLGTVVVASQPDFAPLDLADRALGPGLDPRADIRQVFFTTLERQYQPTQVVSLQHFHWLFFVSTADGWRLALMYSSLGGYPRSDDSSSATGPVGLLTPPQESSQGILGQAVSLWLRDCRAGAVFPTRE